MTMLEHEVARRHVLDLQDQAEAVTRGRRRDDSRRVTRRTERARPAARSSVAVD